MAKTVNGEIPATLWKISGDLDLDLLYAKDGKWLGSRFYAGGSQAEFLLQKSEGNMHSLWKVWQINYILFWLLALPVE